MRQFPLTERSVAHSLAMAVVEQERQLVIGSARGRLH
jgi:hypothetical protein